MALRTSFLDAGEVSLWRANGSDAGSLLRAFRFATPPPPCLDNNTLAPPLDSREAKLLLYPSLLRFLEVSTFATYVGTKSK